MALYDSASLLGIFNRKAGRPAADAVTVASKYQRLSESQSRVVMMLASVFPKALYPTAAYTSLPTLSTTDNQVFTFGTDDAGFPIFPMHARIYTSLNNIPDFPWVDGVDYMNEGTQIRIPNNGTFLGTLYWYGVANPADISSTSEPSLFPQGARELIVIDAVRQFATEYANNPTLAALMEREWDRAWPHWCAAWRKQYKTGGALITRQGTTFGGSTTVQGSSGSSGTGANDSYFNSDYFG